MAQRIELIPDDMSITRTLLGRPDIPRRRTSFSSSARSHELEEGARVSDVTRRRAMQSSNTWTNSSGEILSDKDNIEDRTFFVQEFNRLATKHGVRALDPENLDSSNVDTDHLDIKPGSWFTRKILRKTSSSQSINKNDRTFKHRRSISDLSLRMKSKNNTFKDKDLQELVRLCGLVIFYLPSEYAASQPAVPTCFGATAKYLLQHGELRIVVWVALIDQLEAPTARGVFRIPGSQHVVAALYNHYCTKDDNGLVVAGTVRCPNLPQHIRCDVHDVASAFKKFVSGLPGGILGSLSLFDALVSIQIQLSSSPEMTRTKQSKLRARLIALAIGTAGSQYRRDLICAVFGLLSLVGRAAEMTPRENERGQPLPTSDLMGYAPLGIVFGPLLVGDLLEQYSLHLPSPHKGLILFPVSPPKSRKERQRKNKISNDCSTLNASVDKIKIANSITEMLITHWRDVVRHMKNMKSMRSLKAVRSYKSLEAASSPVRESFLRPSASESFALRKPPDWDNENSPMRQIERCESPTPASRAGGHNGRASPRSNEGLAVRKQRSRPRPMSSQMLSGARSLSILSPTKEENPAECSPGSARASPQEPPFLTGSMPTDDINILEDSPKANSPTVDKAPEVTSARALVEISTQPKSSSKHNSTLTTSQGSNINPIPSRRGSSSPIADRKSYHPSIESENSTSLKKPQQHKSSVQDLQLSGRPSEDKLKDSDPTLDPKYLFQNSRATGPRGSIPSSPHQSYPDIVLSRVSSLGQTSPAMNASRRVSASESGLGLGHSSVPNARSIRHSKTSLVELDSNSAVDVWRTSKDPLTRVSVAEDLASLASLAHALDEEPVRMDGNSAASRQAYKAKFDIIAVQAIESQIPKLVLELERARSLRTLTAEESNFEKLAREVMEEHARGTLSKSKYDTLIRRMGDLAHREVAQNSKDSRPVQNALEKPRIIQGPEYKHLSKSAPSPKKKSLGQYSGLTGNPSLVKQESSVVLSAIEASIEFQAESSQPIISQSPRLSVRALAAKFNFEDPGLTSITSQTKSFSKATSMDSRTCSDSPERIVASYTINPPSPTKSQKSSISNVSVRSIRIAPPADRKVPEGSPPRRMLRSDLKDSTPLRSVPKRQSILLPPESPACCSPAGSPARLSLYDGPSAQVSAIPTPCPMSPHVHFEPKQAATVIEEAVVAPHAAQSQFVPMAINFMTATPLTRSNSLLHAQIRSLQQQLNTKTEEMRHLERQMGTRGNLDMGALSEELREAKKEVQMWKHRAEVAEKQVEVMASLSRRHSSSYVAANGPSTPGQSSSTPFKTSPRDNGVVGLSRTNRKLHGFDGTSSLHSSDGSTETVVHDVRREELRSEGDCIVWVDETEE